MSKLRSLSQEPTLPAALLSQRVTATDPRAEIAVIGMAARAPSAANLEEFWTHIWNGDDCGVYFSPDEMEHNGVPKSQHTLPHWVNKAGALDSNLVSCFDYEYFGLSLGEAKITEPAQRIAVEVAHEALEVAGYCSSQPRNIGVWVCGGSLPEFAVGALLPGLTQSRHTDPGKYFQLEIGNDKDYIASRISFCLNLTGPSRVVQAACSS